MKNVLLSLCLLAFPLPFVRAEPFKSGVISGKDSSPPTTLFLIHREVNPTALVSVYKNLDGKTVATETLVRNADEMTSFTVDQKQLGYTAEVSVVGKRLNFVYIREGKAERAEEDMADNVVVGPLIVDYLQKHWARVNAGEDIKVRYIVPDRKETIQFVLAKVSSSPFKDVGADVVIKMRPDSLVLRALINPLYLRLNSEGSKILALKGRVLPKAADGKGWKDLDADVVYTY